MGFGAILQSVASGSNPGQPVDLASATKTGVRCETAYIDSNAASAPLEIDVPPGGCPWEETRFAFSENNEGELYLCTQLNVYKLMYDPADQEGTGSPAESLIFSPNPVLAGQSVVLDAGEDVFLSRIRITDAGGRSIHDAQFYWAPSPYTWSTNGMKAGTYIVEAWVASSETPIRGKLIVLRP